MGIDTRGNDSVPKMLDAALLYARRGWFVFPLHTAENGRCSCGNSACSSPAKHPWTRNGLLDATCDATQIAVWWSEKPYANIGIATEASGLAVVDVDVKSGGLESLELLIQEFGRLDDTMCVLTGGGGQHYYFASSGNVLVSRVTAFGTQYPGIDMRARGGYVVAPPSSHVSGVCYAWEASSPEEPLKIPQWLLEVVKSASRAPMHKVNEEALPVCKGQRNATLARYAGSLRRQGVSAEALEASLVALNTKQCRPPLEVREVVAIARSIVRYAPHDRETSKQAVQIVFRRLSDIEAKPTRALWNGRVFAGEPCLIAGVPGAGKGYVAAALAAAITCGTSLPVAEKSKMQVTS